LHSGHAASELMVLAVSVMRWASVVRQISLSFYGSGRMVWLGIGDLKDKRTQVTRQDAKLPHQKLGRTELVDTPMALGLSEEQLGELRRSGGILAPEDIAAGVVELVEDDACSGEVMQITSSGGREYVTV
jgi:hypothetical protein